MFSCTVVFSRRVLRVLHDCLCFVLLTGSGEGGPGIPAPFSREPLTPSFRHRHPEYPFLSQSRTRAQTLANPDSRIAVKSRIPITFPESRTAFWSNPVSRLKLPDLVKSRVPITFPDSLPVFWPNKPLQTQ